MGTAEWWEPTEAERDRAADYLKNAVSDDRLTLDEFNQRLDAVYAARSTHELHAVLGSVPPPLRRHPQNRWWTVVVATAAAAVLAGAVAVSVGRLSAAAARSCGCHPSAILPNPNVAAANPAGTPSPVACVRSVPFSAMETIFLNEPFWLPLPNRSQAPKCFAAAGLSTTTQPTSSAIHVHLDLYFMPGSVQVPRRLGVDPATGAHTAVYTDNDQGVVTVAGDGSYTLGQLFDEWGHPLGSDSVGVARMLDGYPMQWFVNGIRISNPAALVLRNHQEIECFQDRRGDKINPTGSYDFPAGY